MNESWKNITKHDGRMYGRLTSDEEFSKRIRHVMKLVNSGYPVNWYRDKFNQVRVLRNGEWWVIDQLAEHEKLYDWSIEHG